MEIWRKAVGCFPHVEVSNIGNVRLKKRICISTRNGKPNRQLKAARQLSPDTGTHGYHIIKIKVGPERKKFLVHRLVARTFVAGYANGLTVNHIDGNKLNNKYSNLEWITRSENTAKQWASGLVNLRGENHPGHKLKNAQVKSILLDKRSVSVLAKEFGVSISIIYKCRDGTRRAFG